MASFAPVQIAAACRRPVKVGWNSLKDSAAVRPYFCDRMSAGPMGGNGQVA